MNLSRLSLLAVTAGVVAVVLLLVSTADEDLRSRVVGVTRTDPNPNPNHQAAQHELVLARLDAVLERLDDLEKDVRALRVDGGNAAATATSPSSTTATTSTTPTIQSPPEFCALADFSRGTYHPLSRRFIPSCNLEFKYTSNCFKRTSHVVVMGDSQSYHLALAIRKGLMNVIRPTMLKESERQNPGPPMTCRTTKFGAKCGEEKTYFHLPPSPVKQPKCKACNGCVSFLDTCGSEAEPGSPPHMLEYLAVEQLYDEEMPSALFNSTQENVLEYLARKKQDPDLFIWNAGAHMQVSESLDEVKTYFRPKLIAMFQEVRRRFPSTTQVWVATNHINIHPEVGEYMYAAAKHTAEQNGVPFLDAMNISLQVPHLYSDDVHLHHENGIYYNTLRDLVFSWFCSVASRGF